MRTFALNEWERARITLSSALQLKESDPDSAASRAYYAAFHAVTALFALQGKSFSKHSAVRSAVHKELILSKKWAKGLGKDFDYLMELREVGDYGGIAHVTVQSATTAIECASRIISTIQKTYVEFPNII